jgi:hypothetical protein
MFTGKGARNAFDHWPFWPQENKYKGDNGYLRSQKVSIDLTIVARDIITKITEREGEMLETTRVNKPLYIAMATRV